MRKVNINLVIFDLDTFRWAKEIAFLLHLAVLLLPEQTLSSRSSPSSSSYYPASCYGVKRSLSNGPALRPSVRPTLLCEVGREENCGARS